MKRVSCILIVNEKYDYVKLEYKQVVKNKLWPSGEEIMQSFIDYL